MVNKEITFTITKIINTDHNNGPIEIEVSGLDFPTGKGDEKAKITKITFVGQESDKIKDIFQANKTCQMTFDDSEVEDDRTPTMTNNTAQAGGFFKESKIPNNLVLEPGDKMRIVYNSHNGSIKLEEVKKEDTNEPEQPKSNDNQKTPPPGNEEKKQPGPNQEDKNPDKDNPQQPEPKDTPYSPQDKKTPDQPPKNPEPSSEQVKQASDKLDQAKNSNNKEEIKNSLNETNDTVRNSSDKDLKKKKEEAEKRLSEIAGKEELRKVIRDEVSNELKKLGIKPEDLSSTKQKFDNLNNNNNNNIEPSQAQEYRTEVLNEAASKKLNELITKLEQAIKKNDKKEIESEKQKLTTFTQDNSDYVQKAYQAQKDKIQQLLEKAKNQQSNQKNKNEGFFRPNNPVMWISGVAIIGLVVGVVLIARSRRKKVAIK